MTELTRIQVASFINHRVGRGENLGYIARRYKTSVAILLRLNNIHNPRSLRVGQTLKVPLPRAAQRGEYLSVKPQKTTAAKKMTKKSKVVVVKAAPKHKVRRGETLTGIARHYGVTMDSLLHFNRLKTRDVRIGQRLKIPNDID